MSYKLFKHKFSYVNLYECNFCDGNRSMDLRSRHRPDNNNDCNCSSNSNDRIAYFTKQCGPYTHPFKCSKCGMTTCMFCWRDRYTPSCEYCTHKKLIDNIKDISEILIKFSDLSIFNDDKHEIEIEHILKDAEKHITQFYYSYHADELENKDKIIKKKVLEKTLNKFINSDSTNIVKKYVK